MKPSRTLSFPAIISAAALVFFAAQAHAAVLLSFESSTLTSGSTSWQSDNAQSNANIDQATFSLGPGLKDFDNNAWAANRWRVDVVSPSATQGDAVDDDAYWSFTLTPDTGFTMDLTSIEITLEVQNTTTSPNSFFFSQGTAPGTSLITDVNSSSATSFTQTSGTTAQTFNVGLSGLTGLTSATEIRLYGYNGTATDRYANIAAGDFVVNGSIIPEPSAIILVTIGGVVAMAMRKRKTRKS